MNLIEASKSGATTELFAYVPYMQQGVFGVLAVFVGVLTVLALVRARIKKRALERDPRRLED